MLGGSGAFFLAQAGGARRSLERGEPGTAQEAFRVARGAEASRDLGLVLVGLGGAALASGALMFAAGGAEALPAISVSPPGAGVSIAW